jgi:Tol biopolymer transport system component
VWSPDGTRIAFFDESAGRGTELVTVRPDGTELTRVRPEGLTGEVVSFTWAPDGRRILPHQVPPARAVVVAWQWQRPRQLPRCPPRARSSSLP